MTRRDLRAAVVRRVRSSATAQRLAERVLGDVPAPPPVTRPAKKQAPAADAPTPQDIADVAFVRTLMTSGHLEHAAARAVRTYIGDGLKARGHSLAHAFSDNPATVEIGDLCQAMTAVNDERPAIARERFSRVRQDVIVRAAAPEYLRTMFQLDRPAADALLAQLRRDAAGDWYSPLEWLMIGRTCFAYGDDDASAWAVDVAAEQLAHQAPSPRRDGFERQIAWLRDWYGRADAARREPAPASAGVPIGLLDYTGPDLRAVSSDLGDHAQTVAVLGHLARRRGVTFAGDAETAEFARQLQQQVPDIRRLDGESATVELVPVARDASERCELPDRTWLLAVGNLLHPMFDRFDFLPNPRLRPIFVGLHIEKLRMLTDDAVAYLRRHEPIGCRDWATVHLLKAAGVEAFFSGCVTSTLDTVVPAGTATTAGTGTTFVDARGGGGRHVSTSSPAVKRRAQAGNLRAARDLLIELRDTSARVVTSKLLCYLPLRSLGVPVEFRPGNPADLTLDGLAGIDDATFEAMQQGLNDKLAAVLDAILAGKSEDDVYAVWRAVCADDVAAADATWRSIDPLPSTHFDLAAACATVRAASTVRERTQPAPDDGPELHVEFSLDGNLKRHMGVVLESIVTHTRRPVRLYVLCRDHDERDYDRMARLFPTVSFVWLPTDDVDYGDVIGMLKHISVATMDRLLLPDLLPDLPRIVHHDLDAVCLADLAELHDMDLGGAPLAARDQMHPNGGSGFRVLRHGARRLRTPELSREFVLRTHSRLPYDFPEFNAGIMVLDLERMRADGFGRNFLPYVERFGLNDQSVLNVYAGGTRSTFGTEWNAFPRLEPSENGKILHWLGPLKPWKPTPYVARRAVWHEYEDRYARRVEQQTVPSA